MGSALAGLVQDCVTATGADCNVDTGSPATAQLLFRVILALILAALVALLVAHRVSASRRTKVLPGAARPRDPSTSGESERPDLN